MYNNERMTFKVKNDKGVEIEYEVLFTFESDETGKKYIVYTDNLNDKEDTIKVYASSYTGEGDNITLEAIETDKEWETINKILDEIQSKVQEQSASEE